MALTQKQLNDKLRVRFMDAVKKTLADNGEEILITGSNEFAIPCVDETGAEKFMVITFKVPSGSRDGDEYDGYSMAQEYEMKLAEKAEKKAETAKKKAEKIERDKAKREKAKAEKENKQ